MTNRVLVAMSGGVDSSVAAALLQQQGYEAIGVTMDTGYGAAPQQAAAVCAALGIAHHLLDVRASFHAQVIEPFIQSYLHGQTPNPCVNCNASLKFPAFLPLMEKLKADFFATGHYVRLRKLDGRYVLHCAADSKKDQSYFLYKLPQAILSRCLFPLGELTKEQVRELALRYQLPSAQQKDSYDVCFVTNGDYRALLANYVEQPFTPGEILNVHGEIVGEHKGLANYTIGQRRGLDLALGYPAYVLRLDTRHNRLIVGKRSLLYAEHAFTAENNWLPFAQLTQPIEAQVKIRYLAVPRAARLVPLDNSCVKICFAEPEWGITPGQSAVFYQNDLLLGGGIIQQA